MWYKEYKTSLGNTLATRRMTPRFLLILAKISDIWLDQVKLSLIITPKNLVKRLAQWLQNLLKF